MNKSIIYVVVALILLLVGVVVYLGTRPSTSLTLERTTITTQDWKVDISGTAKGIRAVAVEVSTPNGEKKTPIPPIQIADKSGKFRQSVPLFDEATLFTAGEPFVEGDYTITVTSTNPKQKVDQTAKITLEVPPAPTLEISEKTPDKITGKISDPKAKVQADISQEEIPVNATGEFTITSPGIGDVTITAINWAGKKSEKNVSINKPPIVNGTKKDEPVLPEPVPPPRITQPLPNQKFQFDAGNSVQFTVKVTGGDPPYNYSADGLPAGAILRPSGQFVWSNAIAGDYPVTLTVSDTMGTRDQVPIQIVIREPLKISQPLPNQEFSANEGEPVQFPVDAMSDQTGQRATIPVKIIIHDTGKIVFTFDPPPPSITQKTSVTITGRVQYPMLGNLVSDSLNLQSDGSFQYTANLKEGANTISFSVRDKNNPQKQVERTITIFRDTKPPYFSDNGKPTTQIVRSKEDTTAISVTVVDETSPLSSIAPSWGERPQPSGKEHLMTIQAAVLRTGDNQLTAIDAAGNSAVLKVIVIPPLEVRVTDPKPGTITKENAILVKGTVTGGYGGIALKIGNRTLTPSQGSFSVDAHLNEGENKIMVVPQDDLGEKPPIGVTVTRDAKRPVFIYNGSPVTSIERSIVEGNFTVDITDESGIASVTLNAKGISSRDRKTWAIPVNDLKQGDNELIATDKATNTASLKIIAKSDQREKEAWKRAQAAFDERRYADAKNVLNYLEKEFGINASVRLFRGMITYQEALEGKDVLERYNKLKGATQDLDLALADGDTYPKGSDNIHYNRYYLGMTYYKLWVLAKQIQYENSIIDQHKSRAAEKLGSFIANVGNQVPTLKQEAERILRELK